jgi:hypothetical protein
MYILTEYIAKWISTTFVELRIHHSIQCHNYPRSRARPCSQSIILTSFSDVTDTSKKTFTLSGTLVNSALRHNSYIARGLYSYIYSSMENISLWFNSDGLRVYSTLNIFTVYFTNQIFLRTCDPILRPSKSADVRSNNAQIVITCSYNYLQQDWRWSYDRN